MQVSSEGSPGPGSGLKLERERESETTPWTLETLLMNTRMLEWNRIVMQTLLQ